MLNMLCRIFCCKWQKPRSDEFQQKRELIIPGKSRGSTGINQGSSLPHLGSPQPHLKNQIPREAWALNIH